MILTSPPKVVVDQAAYFAARKAELDPAKVAIAATYLRFNTIQEADVPNIRAEIEADPVNWVTPYHQWWGMYIRNALRVAAYGEAYFGVENLDDYYHFIVEEAVK